MLDPATLLPLDRVARLERVLLATRRRLVGTEAGRHRSARRGTSLEFADHRPYAPGDDLRRIDQHALARFDQLMVRRFDAEDDAAVRLLLDTSASMDVGGKWHHAASVAAAFGFAALLGRDTVRVHTLSTASTRLFSGRRGVTPMLEHLAALPTGGRTDFDAAIGLLVAQPGPPGVTVVVSDLLSRDWAPSLDRLAHPRRDVVVVHVLHPDELHTRLHGDHELVDVETGERVEVTMNERSRRTASDDARRWQVERAAEVTARGHAYHLVLVGDDPVPAVLAHTDAGSSVR